MTHNEKAYTYFVEPTIQVAVAVWPFTTNDYLPSLHMPVFKNFHSLFSIWKYLSNKNVNKMWKFKMVVVYFTLNLIYITIFHASEIIWYYVYGSARRQDVNRRTLASRFRSFFSQDNI